MPFSGDQIGGAIASIGQLARDLVGDYSDRQHRKRVAAMLDEMLRNPKYPFRTTKRLGRVFGDRTPELVATRAILSRMPGVRGNLGNTDSWINEDNWEWDDSGALRRTEDGQGILKPGIEPGLK